MVGDILELITAILQLQTAKVAATANQQDHEVSTRNLLGRIERYFHTLESYLRDMDGRDLESSSSELEHVKQARKLAFTIEDIAEEFVLQVPYHFHVHHHKITEKLHKVRYSRKYSEEVEKLSSQMGEVFKGIDEAIKLKKFIAPPLLSQSSTINHTSQAAYPNAKSEQLVGIDGRLAQFLHLLSESRSNGFVIAFVLGPRGSGKTTLVSKACEMLKDDFLYHAFITIPYSGMVGTILESVCVALGIPVHQGDDATQKLRSHLAMNTYLLVFDGLWSKEDWASISNALPVDSNGSKIIICTSRQDIASHCAVPYGCVFHLPVLNMEEGMQLFCLKAFRDTKCPQHLRDLSESIVRKCDGLPIAIAAVGHSVSNKQTRKAELQKVHDNLGYEMESSRSLSIMGKILQEEYNQLSHGLRSCFLYLCNFPGDCTINRGRLLRLWIAEKLIKKREGMTMEQVADDHLNELIQRNLVHVTRKDFEGRVRSCRVMSLVREFITCQSRKKCFSAVLSNTDRSLVDEARRLSLHNISAEGLVQLTKQGQESKLKCTRSLMMFGGQATTGSSNSSLPKIIQRMRMSDPEALADNPRLLMLELLRSFKLLRVLDLEILNTEDTSFPTPVFKLILLRYLSLRGHATINKVPKSIGELSQLETLDLRGTSVKKLPKTILELRELLYLLVGKESDSGDCVGVEIPGRIGHLSKLQKLTLIRAKESEGRTLAKQLEKLTELRTLGITGVKEEEGEVLCESIQKMKNIASLSVTSVANEAISLDFPGMRMFDSHMHNLKLGGRLHRIPEWVQNQRSLAKIKLKGSESKTSPLEALSGMPCLCELVLSDAYTGEEMRVRAGWFQKLRVLEIENFSELQKVIIVEGAMPQLQKLRLRGCQRLRTVRTGIHNLSKLDELLLIDMPEQLSRQITGEDPRFSEIISVCSSSS